MTTPSVLPIAESSHRRPPEHAAGLLCAGSQVVNFRDVARCSTPDVRLRPGQVFRSATLSHATDADLAVLRSLRVRLVLDLRTDGERDADGVVSDRLGAECRQISLMRREWAMPGDDDGHDGPSSYLAERYGELLADSADGFAAVVESILTRPGAAVVHCMAGKDRTGLAVALMLMIVGVDEETIVADYERSADAMSSLRALFLARFPERADYLAAQPTLFDAAPGAALRSALRLVRHEFGGPEAYLRQGGLADGAFTALRLLLRH
jgi:protein-tyrosine phosphatase